jgi:hypothetical protein
MFVSKLPPKPDFDMLAAAAPASADRRTFVLALMGNLICSWSNNESLFIYVLMILLRTDEASAAVVFATLNTTRARLDLIQRLAKIRVSDKALSKRTAPLARTWRGRSGHDGHDERKRQASVFWR